MQQQFAWPPRLMVEMGRGLVFRDVGVDEIELAARLVGIGLGDASAALAQYLDLGAMQDETGFEGVLDQVIVTGAAVLRGITVGRPHRAARASLAPLS